MSQQLCLEHQVPSDYSGLRFDQVAAELFPQYSRARLQSWIRAGELRLGGRAVKPNAKVVGGESVALQTSLQAEGEWLPQALDLDILYEDEDILVLNKAAGVVVHPAAGNPDGTLLNALLHHAPEVESVPRAGIVHRLDKDTTGLMVVAKNLPAQNHLVKQLQSRSVSRIYSALVWGQTALSGTVDAPIGRHPRQRKKMAVVDFGGKPAVSHYQSVAQWGAFSHVRVKLETGRTHQIRVHMAHLQHPLIGDPVYGGRPKFPKKLERDVAELVRDFPRQALHAGELGLIHPRREELMQWQSPLPDDMRGLIQTLARSHANWSDN